MSNHSQAPWRIERTAHGTYVRAAHGGLVATLEAGFQSTRNHDGDLMVSAPELLVMAKAALAALTQNKTFQADIDAAKEWLSAAIAKAEGRLS